MINRILPVFLVFFCFIPASHGEDIYRDCINLVTDYAYFRDRFDAVEFSNLFTEDASLTVGGTTWRGRDEILKRIENLDSSSSIRHLMSTIRINPIDDLNASGVSYATIYSAPAGANSVEGFAVIGEYHDSFVRTEEGWKIQNRELHFIFTYEDN